MFYSLVGDGREREFLLINNANTQIELVHDKWGSCYLSCIHVNSCVCTISWTPSLRVLTLQNLLATLLQPLVTILINRAVVVVNRG